MNDFRFGQLLFEIREDKIGLVGFGDSYFGDKLFANFVEIHIAGENKDRNLGSKMIASSEGRRLRYVSYIIENNNLVITQRNDLIEATTFFTKYNDTSAIKVYTSVKNISDRDIFIEEVSSFVLTGICGGITQTQNTYFYKFYQSHLNECQPRRLSLFDMGFYESKRECQKSIRGINIGSWSTKEELPQAIIEYNDSFLMFEIESNNSWFYELSDISKQLYLYFSGANFPYGDFYKKLSNGETFTTPTVCFALSSSLNNVLGDMTVYRRKIKGRCLSDENLPVIFNEFMHLSWDQPNENTVYKMAKTVKELGADYYVIDCGWHDNEPTNLYSYVGKWKESQTRFPNGVRKVTDFIRSIGLKAGLWIEPEAVGRKCTEMFDYYDEDCFIHRHGQRIAVRDRFYLDYRNEKVIKYMTDTIRRMVNEYGADYIKLDYNQDIGAGTDLNCESAGEGLIECSKAYLEWIDNIRKEFPSVIFETCASGGMRMDYETLKHFSITSSSDQEDYIKYAYICGNILSAILPEQCGVWSYPVDSFTLPKEERNSFVDNSVTDDTITMTMINSFLFRMHLSSHLELLSEKQKSLVSEGIKYFKTLTEIKKKALPFLPLGFTDFSKEVIVSGLKYERKIYLSVWNLSDKNEISIPIYNNIKSAKIAYPLKNDTVLKIKKEKIDLIFTNKNQARFLEIEI